jgi:hypothetical protein
MGMVLNNPFLGNKKCLPQPLGEFGGGGGVFVSSITANMTCGPPSPPPIGGGLGGLAVELAVSFVTQF